MTEDDAPYRPKRRSYLRQTQIGLLIGLAIGLSAAVIFALIIPILRNLGG